MMDMPKLISGNTQAPSIMIGEKGAAMMTGADLPTTNHRAVGDLIHVS